MATKHAVTIGPASMKFDPATLAIAKGDSVEWTNKMGMPHTATSDDGSSFDSNNIGPGKTYSHTFDSAGSFPYHCKIHPFMKGTITVA